MFRIIWLLSLIVFSSGASAATDYQCMNDCTNKGYMYQFCTSRCSYDSSPQQVQPQAPIYQPQRTPQTDYQCLNNCTAKGYMYQYCQQQCSY